MWELSEAGDVEDEGFPPLPPPDSPGHADPDQEEADLSKLGDVPAAKRRTVKRPQPKLDSQRLISDRGLPALRSLFHNVPFQGRGHEEENLQLLLQKMENWAHRLFPRLTFQDFMDKVENLGAKKEVQTCLKRIRLDMPLTHDDFTNEAPQQPEDLDLFTTPVHSTPVPPVAPPVLTEVQRSRMELNRRGALERRRRSQQVPDPSDSSQVLHLSPGGECTSSQEADAQRSSSTERWGEGE